LPVSRALLLGGGLVALALAWAPAADALLGHGFPAHMARHMAVVAIAAPLLALGLVGTRFDPSRRAAWLFPAVPASLLELFVVWGWHAPAAHDLARTDNLAFAAEQATFLASGLWLWIACFGHAGDQRPQRAGAGVLAMLLTSIHMTLLGVLLSVTTRPLYAAHHHGGDALDGQHVGGIVMLLVGGAVYLAGGVALAARLLRAGDGAARTEGSAAP
jgi:putative membrane protein